jgi:hypothetical protein
MIKLETELNTLIINELTKTPLYFYASNGNYRKWIQRILELSLKPDLKTRNFSERIGALR